MTACKCYLCRTHSIPGLEDYWPSTAISDHGGGEAEDSPASEGSFVELLTIRIGLGSAFMAPGEGSPLHFYGKTDVGWIPTEYEIKPPPAYRMETPLRCEGNALLSEEDGDLFLTLRLWHEA